MRDRLILRAFLLAWEWLPKIPESIAKPLAAFVADLAWIGNGKGVRQLQTNLARVTGLQFDETRDLTRRGIRAYAEYWRILFQLERFTAEEREARVILHGFERVDAQQLLGCGIDFYNAAALLFEWLVNCFAQNIDTSNIKSNHLCGSDCAGSNIWVHVISDISSGATSAEVGVVA